jgi:transglutaminase-like putative cysteine protease
MRIIPLLIAALLALFIAAARAPAQASPPAFPLRFDFDTSTDRWANQSPIDDHSLSEWTPACGRTGGGIHMRGAGGEPDQVRQWRKVIPNPPAGRELRVHAWVRGARVENLVAIAVRAQTTRPHSFGDFNSTQLDHPLRGDFDWTELDTAVKVPRGCANVQVLLMLVGDGEAWFDDVEIELGEEVPLIEPGLFALRGAIGVRTTDESRADAAVLIPVPLVRGPQAPLTFTLDVDPPGRLESVAFEPREGSPNWLARVRLKDLKPAEDTRVTWQSVVVVAPSSFAGVPERVPLPTQWDDAAEPWLVPTRSVESDDPAIRATARDIKGDSSNEIEIIQAVIDRAREIYAAQEGACIELTAVQALTKRGTSTSGANLIAALLRASGIPARLVGVCPAWAGPVRAHFLVEAYVPSHGWYAIEPTHLRAPWPSHPQVALAVVSPADENASAARSSAPGGTPFLSVVEINPRDAPLKTLGLLGAAASGNELECTPLRNFPEDTPESVWHELLAAAKRRWERSIATDRCPPSGPSPEWFRTATPASVLERLAGD